MRQIGSKTEKEIKEQLIISNHSLFKSEEKRRLLEVIRGSFPQLKTAYILNWLPEQSEDIYKILINDGIVARIELDRYDAEVKPVIASEDISQYRYRMNKQNQIKLTIALDLVKEELKSKD